MTRSSAVRSALLLVLGAVLFGAGCHKGASTPIGKKLIDTNSFVSGKVVDGNGNPVPGAQVQIVGSDLGSGVTDGNGVFSVKLKDLPASGEASVKILAPGYTESQRRFTVVANATASLLVEAKQIEKTTDTVVTAVSPTISVVTPGQRAQIDIPVPAATLGTTGNVSVEVTSGNPKVERDVFPGTFMATDPSVPATQTGLSSISFVEVRVTNQDTGERVESLNGTANLTLEIPIGTINPETREPFKPGDLVPIWSFDEKTGLWSRGKDAGGADINGVVQAPGADARLLAIFPIPHFSWWNMDYPLTNRHCLSGRVVDSLGRGIPNVDVTARGVDQNYEFGKATDALGYYSFDVFRGSVAQVSAVVGARTSQTVTVNVPDTQSTSTQPASPTNICTPVANLVLTDGTCVSGFVKDALGNPIPGVTVEVLGQNLWGNSDATGAYCVEGLATNQAITLRATTYILGRAYSREIVITTGPTLGRCIDNTCTRQDLVIDTTLAGVMGQITNAGTGLPLSGVVVWTNEGPLAQTVADGRYCLPATKSSPTQVNVSYFHAPSGTTYTLNQTVLTGNITGDCADPLTSTIADFAITLSSGRITGTVINELGNPVPGMNVFVGGYPVGSTNAAGAFDISAPIQPGVTVNFTSYASNGQYFQGTSTVDVTQAAPAAVTLNRTVDLKLACIQGTVSIGGGPASGVQVSTNAGIATSSDSFGSFCLDVVRGQTGTISFFKTLPSGVTLWHSQSFGPINQGGSCATGNCVDIGNIVLNESPAITLVSGTPNPALARQLVNISVTANDPDSAGLTYFWAAEQGTFANPNAAATTWEAPLVASSTTFFLNVQVNDGEGGITSGGVVVTVNPAPNQRPVISSVVHAPSIQTGASTPIAVTASDSDGDSLTYTYTASGGLVIGAGANVTYQAPSAAGVYTVTVMVSDGQLSETGTATITVTAPPNRAPVIAGVGASPTSVGRGDPSSVTVSASDPDGDSLTFSWSATGGTISGTGSSITWIAPAGTGTYNVSVIVSDGALTDSDFVTITVTNVAPVINSVTASPQTVIAGQVSSVAVSATDPDGDPVTFTWTASGGTPLTGSGPGFNWTAPVTQGPYTITVTASDGLLTANQNVIITVGNLVPQVTSIGANPSSVFPGSTSTVTVVASDPDASPSPLSYTWSVTGPAASTVTGTGSTVTWNGSATEGTYVVQVIVSDGAANVTRTVNIACQNRAPIITNLTATPTTVGPTGQSAIAVTASDPDGQAVSYSYGATGGTFTGSGANVTWNAPASAATYTITATVSDGSLTAQQTINVTVTPDTTPPTVTAVNPLNGATGVPVASTVSVTFSEPVNIATVTGSSFTVSTVQGNVSGSISFSAGNTVATFTPGANLVGSLLHTVTVGTAVQDIFGNALASTFTSTFTTAAVVPTISINDVSLAEGNAGTSNATFTLTLSQATGQTVTVSAQSADGTATAGADYVALGATTVTFSPLQTTAQVTVVVNGEVTSETNETFFVNLTLPVNATIADAQGLGTITNDDGSPSLSIVDVTQVETDAGTTNFVFNVNLLPASGLTVTVNFTTTDGTATVADSDYLANSGGLTFNPGETLKTVTVVVNGDTKNEPNEAFTVDLSGEVNATISDAQATGTISNDDAVPSITIADVTVGEGAGPAVFGITLSNPSSQTVSVTYATANGTAVAAGDYTTASGSTSFSPGQTFQTVSVTLGADSLDEASETFFVDLSSPSNATIADSQAVATITDDDPTPTLSVDDPSAAEQNAGTGGSFVFTVTLSAASGQTVGVTATVADGTATTAGGDYTAAASTPLSFAPGETTKTVPITVFGDLLNEANETVTITLSAPSNAAISDGSGTGTITNDDALPTISVDDVTNTELNTGSQVYTFTVSLSAASGQVITVDVATANNTATTGDADYVANGATLTFNPGGATSQTFLVTVNGDVTNEPTESFFVNLTNPSATVTISDPQGVGTITNDDIPPLTISSLSVWSGPVGAVVRINGTNFDPIPANNVVAFNGTVATVQSGTTTTLLTTVPVGATTGFVSVNTGGGPGFSPAVFTVLTAPASIDTNLIISKALSSKQHEVPITVNVPQNVPDIAVMAVGVANAPNVNRYLYADGNEVRVFDAASDSPVAALDYSTTNNELAIDIAVTTNGQKAYVSIFGPLYAPGAVGELQIVNNLGTTPTLGSRVNLRSQSPLVEPDGTLAVTPDGSRVIFVSRANSTTLVSGYIVIVDTTTDTVTNTIVLPDATGTTYTNPAGFAIHPSGSHLYVLVSDDDDSTTNSTGRRLLTFDLGSLTFVGASTLNAGPSEFWGSLAIRPSGTSGFLTVHDEVSGISYLRDISFASPSAPSLGASYSLGTYYHTNFELECSISPDGGMLYVRGSGSGEEIEVATDVANALLRGFDIRGATPVLFDEVYIGSMDMYVHLTPKWLLDGRFLAFTPGVFNPASKVTQSGLVHVMQVFPAGAPSDLAPFKGGVSGPALTNSTMTVSVFDDVTSVLLPGVSVSLSNDAGALTASGITNASGVVTFPGLTGPQNVTVAPAGGMNFSILGVNAQNVKLPAQAMDGSRSPTITVVVNNIPGAGYASVDVSARGHFGDGGGGFLTSVQNVATKLVAPNERFTVSSVDYFPENGQHARRSFPKALPGAHLFWNATLAPVTDTVTYSGNVVMPSDLPNGFTGGNIPMKVALTISSEGPNDGSPWTHNGFNATGVASEPYSGKSFFAPIAGVSNFRINAGLSLEGATPGVGFDPRVLSQRAGYDSNLDLGANPAASLINQDFTFLNAPFIVQINATAFSSGMYVNDPTPTVVFRDTLGPGGATGKYQCQLFQQQPGDAGKAWLLLIGSTDPVRISGGNVTFTVPDLPPAAAAESFTSSNNRPIFLQVEAVDHGGAFNFNALSANDPDIRSAGIDSAPYIQGVSKGTLTAGASMLQARRNHGAAAMTDGNVIYGGGGVGGPSPYDSVEIYTVGANTVDYTRAIPGGTQTLMSTPRNEVPVVKLLDDRIMFVSGGGAFGAYNVDGDIYNPSNGQFSVAGAGTSTTMAVGRIGHAAVLLNDGRVLVVGGITGPGGSNTTVEEIEIYDPVADSWTTHNSGGSVLPARDGPSVTVLNPAGGDPTYVLVTGGRYSVSQTMATTQVTTKAVVIQVPNGGAPTLGPELNMNTPRIGCAAVRTAPGVVYLLGGVTAESPPEEPVAATTSVEVFTQGVGPTGTFSTGPGALLSARGGSEGILIKQGGVDKILLVGGARFDEGGFDVDGGIELYDFAAGGATDALPNGAPRANVRAVKVPRPGFPTLDRIFIIGGRDPSDASSNLIEYFDPN